MSRSGDPVADEPRSPAELVKSSADMLVRHAANTIDVITESLSAAGLIETDPVPTSRTEAEDSTKAISGHIAEGSVPRKDEPGSGYAGHTSDAPARDASDRRARSIYGLEGENNSGRQGVTGAGSEPVFVGVDRDDAGAHRPASSISASTVFRLPGEVSEPKSRRASSSLQSITNETVSGTSSTDRRESTDDQRDAEYVEEKDDDAIKSLEIFAFSSSSDPQRKQPETLSALRWKKAYQHVKKDNVMKKMALSSPIGTGATLDGHALGFLSIHSGIRKTLFAYLYNEKTEYLILGIILAHHFILILKAEYKWITNFRPTVKALQVADIVLTSVSTAECVCRIITLGFYKSPHAYLRNSYNKLDLVVVVDSWVHIVRTMILGRDGFIRLLVFRVYRGLFILRQFPFIGNVLAAFGALGQSIRPLELMLLFTGIFMVFYANMGVHFFGYSGSLRMRSFFKISNTSVSMWTLHHLSFGLSTGIALKRLTFMYKFVGEIVIAGAEENQMGRYPILRYFVHGLENPNFGATHFENIGTAMLILIQILSFEGWSLIMIQLRNSQPTNASDAYFIVFVIVGGYFISNVFIAAFSGVFLRVRQEHQLLLRKYRRDKAFSLANAVAMATVLKDAIVGDNQNLNWRQRLRRRTYQFRRSLSREGSKLRSSITRRMDSFGRASSFGLTGLDNEPTGRLSFSWGLSNGARFGRSVSRSAFSIIRFWEQKLSYKCRILVQSKVFTYGVLFAISLNAASMCTFNSKSTESGLEAIHALQISTVIIFYLELIVRFLAAGPYGFVDERINVIDTVIVLVSTHALKFHMNAPVPIILGVRLVRWFYVKRSSQRDREVEASPVLASVGRVAGSLASVFFSFLILIINTSIFSMELWAGRMLPVDGFTPRTNHDSMPEAMLLWFTVTTSESWVNQMWYVLRPGTENRWLSPVIFVIYWVVTAIALLNLIIAAILEETELTDYQKKVIQKRDHVKRLQVKHIHRLSSTRSSDWLLGGIEYLKDAKRRISSMSVTSMSIFPSSRSESPEVQEQRTGDSVPPTASSSRGSETSEGPSTTDTHVDIPGSGTGRASSSIRGLQVSGGVSPRTFLYKPVDKVDDPADVNSKGRRLRRSSASDLSSITTATLPPPRRRRPSQVSEKMFLRSGFTGADLAHTAVDGGNRTALQAALLAVIDERAVGAGGAAAKEAGVQSKRQAASDPILSGRKRGSRVSFLLSDFEAIQVVEEKAAPWWMNERSLFLFRAENRTRVFIKDVVEHEIYRRWQVTWAVVGTVIMVETHPNGEYRIAQRFLTALDGSTFVVFTTDMILKSVAYGFLLTREAYLEDPYNMIDVVNLLLHSLYLRSHLFIEGTEMFAKAMLILMACRPYRLIPRFQGLRSLSTSLLRTIPAIFQLLLFTVLVYAVFALVGVQLYSSRFRRCTDTKVTGHVDCIGMFYNGVGVLAPRTWVNSSFHFDGFLQSMLSLFVASTFDNWLEYFLYTGMDIPHRPDQTPSQNSHVAHAIYFVSFACIGGFFILRMFVALFIDRIGVISGTKLLTERQKLWRDNNRLIQSLTPKRRPAVVTGFLIRGCCSRIVHCRSFELLSIFVVSLNCCALAASAFHYSGEGYMTTYFPREILVRLEYCFCAIYSVEALLKVLGLRMKDWWYDKWNPVEMVTVVLTIVCIRTDRNVVSSYIARLNVISRIFRLFRYVRSLRTVANTILVSLPSMVDIVALMGICLFSLSQVGAQVFYNIKDGICIRNGGEASFETWLTSFLLLLQVTTLDNWSCLMIDITLAPPNCVPDVSIFTSDCGFPLAGIAYMLICIFITTYIFSNLFIAQILDTITFGLLNENALLTPAHLMAYRDLWALEKYDGKCTGHLPHHKLKEFLIQLGHPLGGRRYGFVEWFSRIEYEIFNFRNRRGIPFRSLLETICLYKVGSRALELPVRIQREKHIQTIYQNGAAMKIQGLVRGFLQRRRSRKDILRETISGDDKKRGSESADSSPAEDPVMVSQGMARAPGRVQSHLPTSAAAAAKADMMRTEVVAESPSVPHGDDTLGLGKT